MRATIVALPAYPELSQIAHVSSCF